MERASWWLVVLTTVVGFTGCGSSTDSPQSAGSQGPGPDVVVREFLEAVRTGKDQVAGSLLTKVAHQKTKEMDLLVSPPGSDTASFTVGEFEVEADGTAQVASTWTDVGDDGKPNSDTIIWVLKREPEGWRVSGMATKVFDDRPPLVLNFEDPADMIRKQEETTAEMTRRTQAAAAMASRPAVGGTQVPYAPAEPVSVGNGTSPAAGAETQRK